MHAHWSRVPAVICSISCEGNRPGRYLCVWHAYLVEGNVPLIILGDRQPKDTCTLDLLAPSHLLQCISLHSEGALGMFIRATLTWQKCLHPTLLDYDDHSVCTKCVFIEMVRCGCQTCYCFVTTTCFQIYFRYQFLEDLWARRKKKKPISSIEFALMEQQADPHGHHHDITHSAVTAKKKSLELQVPCSLQHRAAKQYCELQEV